MANLAKAFAWMARAHAHKDWQVIQCTPLRVCLETWETCSEGRQVVWERASPEHVWTLAVVDLAMRGWYCDFGL